MFDFSGSPLSLISLLSVSLIKIMDDSTTQPSWGYEAFKMACGLNDEEVTETYSLLKKELKKKNMWGFKLNSKACKARLGRVLQSLSLPPFLENVPEAVRDYHLRKLAGYINYNKRRGYEKDDEDDEPNPALEPSTPAPSKSEPRSQSSFKLQPSTPAPSKSEPRSQSSFKLQTSSPAPLKIEPGSSATPQQQDSGLNLLQLTVHGLNKYSSSICNVTDVLKDKAVAHSMTVDDLDYNAWLGYLKDDISFNEKTQLIFSKPTAGTQLPITNERNWRAAIRRALNAGDKDITFSVEKLPERGTSLSHTHTLSGLLGFCGLFTDKITQSLRRESGLMSGKPDTKTRDTAMISPTSLNYVYP